MNLHYFVQDDLVASSYDHHYHFEGKSFSFLAKG